MADSHEEDEEAQPTQENEHEYNFNSIIEMAEQGTGDGKNIHPDNQNPNLIYSKAQL